MERDFKGIWIPKEIWLARELTIMEKIFLLEIDSLDGKDGCYASNKHFSEFFDLSKNRCTEIIKSLESKGFVTVNHKKSNGVITRRIIKVDQKKYKSLGGIRKTEQGYSENREGGIRKTEQGYSENREGSNTKSSNTESSNTKEAIDDFPEIKTSKSNLSLVGKEPTHAGKKNGNDDLIDLPTELNIDAWSEFVEHRELIAKKKKTPFSELAQKKAINKLIKFDKQIQAEAIDKAIINGWTDVYPESITGKKDPGGAAHTGSEHWVTTKSGKRIDLNNESCMVETNKGMKRLSEVKYSNGELHLC